MTLDGSAAGVSVKSGVRNKITERDGVLNSLKEGPGIQGRGFSISWGIGEAQVRDNRKSRGGSYGKRHLRKFPLDIPRQHTGTYRSRGPRKVRAATPGTRWPDQGSGCSLLPPTSTLMSQPGFAWLAQSPFSGRAPLKNQHLLRASRYLCGDQGFCGCRSACWPIRITTVPRTIVSSKLATMCSFALF